MPLRGYSIANRRLLGDFTSQPGPQPGDRYWNDPSGRGIWLVPDGFTPETSPWNPSNPVFAIPKGDQPFSAEYTGPADADPVNFAPVPVVIDGRGRLAVTQNDLDSVIESGGYIGTPGRPAEITGNGVIVDGRLIPTLPTVTTPPLVDYVGPLAVLGMFGAGLIFLTRKRKGA